MLEILIFMMILFVIVSVVQKECVQAKRAYKRCNTVYCDECGVQLFNEMVYHCPNGYDVVHHKNGYDLCPKCADKKVLADKQKEEEIMEQEEEEEVVEEEEKE